MFKNKYRLSFAVTLHSIKNFIIEKKKIEIALRASHKHEKKPIEP